MWTIESSYQEAYKNAVKNAYLIRNVADLRVQLLGELPAERSSDETISNMLAFHRQRLDAVPDLHVYPELRGIREIIEAEWRGIQNGACLDDTMLAAYVSGFDYYTRHLGQGRMTGCSCIYFPTSDVGPLLAINLDSHPSEKFGPPIWPLLNEHLIIGRVSSGIYNDEISPEIFPVPLLKLLARYCRTTEEAVEMYTRYRLLWHTGNAIVIDRNQTVAMIEKSSCRIGVRFSSDGFGFVTAMTAEEPGMHAYLADRRAKSLTARGLSEDSPDMRYWRGADSRRELMNALLDEAREHPTLETMQRMIQFRDPQRGYVCYNGEVFHPGDPPVEYTLRTVIYLLSQGKAMWWAKEGDVPSFENRQPDIEYSNVLLWD